MASGGHPTHSLSKAKAALGRKDFARAVEKATSAIAAAPKESPAYLVRAEALRRLNRPDRALADLAVAIRLQPDRPSPYVVRAEILKKRCQFDQAIADATHAIFLDPDNAAAYSIRASCRQSIGDADGASEDHEELFRIDPTRPTIQATPARTPSSILEGRDRKSSQEAIWDDESHLFADGKPVDRSYRSRPAIGGDAAEVLGEVSGYKPGHLPKPMPGGRSHPKAPARGISYGLGLLGVGVIAGCLLMMRGGGASATGRESGPPRVSATIQSARADDGGGDPKLASGDDGKGTGSKDPGVTTEPPQVVNGPTPQQATSPTPRPTEGKLTVLRVRQVRFTLAEDGDCLFALDTRGEGQTHEEPIGEPATLEGVSSAVVRKTEAGSYHMVYSFGEVGSTVDFTRQSGIISQPLDGISIDRTAGTLMMTPVSYDKSPGKRSKFTYPRLVRPPIKVVVDFEKLTNYTFIIQLESQSGTLCINVSPKHQPFHDDAKVDVLWIPVTGGKRGRVNLLERPFEPEKVSEYGFHLPVDSSPISDRFSLVFALQGQEAVSVKRLEVEAKVPPSFGSAWGIDKGGLKVKTVFKGGPSERAGLRGGDVLVSLDGEKPQDTPDLIRRLGQMSIGGEAKFIMRRAGQEKTFVVKGE